MLRFVPLLALVSGAAALAAPVPRPSDKELIATHWGKTDGQGEFELVGKQLTIRSAIEPSRGLIAVISNGQANVPRATRTVSGDFEATIKILDTTLPNKDAKHTDAYPATRTGLFVEGGGYAVEFHLYQYFSKINGAVQQEEPTRCVWVDTWFPRGGAGNSLKAAEAGKSTHLRLIRKDKVVSVSYCFDGKDWSAPFAPRQALDFPDEVTVGVFLGHSTYQTVTATFDKFTIEQPKPAAPAPEKLK